MSRLRACHRRRPQRRSQKPGKSSATPAQSADSAAWGNSRLAGKLSRHLCREVDEMAPRANWKGFLEMLRVPRPVALFPAASDTEKVPFNQLNKHTGHRIKYTKVDAETGDEVASDDIIKGYKVDTDTYVTVDKDELENIALESTRTIDIDEFVPRSEIDELY